MICMNIQNLRSDIRHWYCFFDAFNDKSNLSFVGMVCVYTNKTTTSLKANDITANLVLVVSLNFTNSFCQFFHNHAYSFARMLPVGTSTDEKKHDEREKNQVKTVPSFLSSHNTI